ncbi:MAG: hypothetical protein LBE89_02805 [Helicobacteraceae bacterium]|jgi:hypothetical protein|nr:hypothetical protein [Helicobacteraceae bacterium]
MTQGGASIEMIERIGGAFATISIGASMKTPLDSLCKINPAIKALHFDSIGGLRASGKLIAALMEFSAKEPCGEIKRRRAPRRYATQYAFACSLSIGCDP